MRICMPRGDVSRPEVWRQRRRLAHQRDGDAAVCRQRRDRRETAAGCRPFRRPQRYAPAGSPSARGSGAPHWRDPPKGRTRRSRLRGGTKPAAVCPMIATRQRRRLQRRGEFLDQPPGALIRHLGAVGEHRAAILVDDFQVETLLGLLEHDVFGDFGQFRHVLQRLAQRRRGQREFAVDLEAGARGGAALLFVRGRRIGGVLRRNVRGILQLRPGRQAVGSR